MTVRERTLDDPTLMAPLAVWEGRKPPAPAWFEAALAQAPERGFVEVEGARVETLAWGERGKPGLIFLHGGGAHADWWTPLAPFFARDYRVVAPSFTGMGRSDWRSAYDFSQFGREARAAGQALGAYDAAPPLVVGHSFGSRVGKGLAHVHGDELAALVMVDPPYFAPQNRRPPSPPRATKSRRVQTSLEALVARFRLAPPQPCENPFVLDYIARNSARTAPTENGGEGWMLSIDPHFWERFPRVERLPFEETSLCPLALIRGATSSLFQPEDAAHLRSLLPPETPYFEIPEAHHHVMLDQPLAFVAALRALFAVWPAKT